MKASILLAARNEEVTIKACLESLVSQTVNNNVCIDILIGNDDSKDKTEEIALQFEQKYKHVKVYQIRKDKTLLGKVNVLNQLSQFSSSDYLLFADADVIYPVDWAQNLLNALNQGDIVTGVTVVTQGNLWDNFQRLDWMIAFKMIHCLFYVKIPVTSMGNNMGIKKQVLHDIGGFSEMPFSVAEDFALFRKVVNKNGTFIQLFSKKVLAETESIKTFKEWIHQRWRWMQGAKKLSFPLKALNYLNIIFYPLLIFVGAFFNELLWFFPLVYGCKLFFVIYLQKKIGLKVTWLATLLFDPMHTFCYLSLLFYSIQNPSISWKGRLYKSE